MSKNGNTYFDRSVIEPGGETEGRTEMSQNPRQSKSIRAQLLTAMQVGEYAHCDRLPRESVLSEMLGISRTQLRDILASLPGVMELAPLSTVMCWVHRPEWTLKWSFWI